METGQAASAFDMFFHSGPLPCVASYSVLSLTVLKLGTKLMGSPFPQFRCRMHPHDRRSSEFADS